MNKLVAGVTLAAGVTLTLVVSGQGRGSHVNAPLARTSLAVRVRVLDVDATDLVLEHRAVMRIQVPWSGATTISVGVGRPRGAAMLAGSVRLSLLHRSRTVLSVPMGARIAQLLSICGPLRLRVAVRGPSGQTRSVDVKVKTDPPRCGNFFAAGSFWNVPLGARASIDPLSREVSKTLRSFVSAEDAAHYYPTVNTTSYSVPIYTVASDQHRVPVVLDNTAAYANGLRAQLKAGVPIPPGARAAAGRDGHMVIWQAGTDTMWELWQARRSGGRWHAAFGGRIDHESTFDGSFYSPSGIQLGATGSSIALAGGLITLDDIKRRTIEHALAFAVPAARYAVWAVPASRSDGYVRSPAAIPEGARFRLPASLNIKALHLPPLVAMIARAVQRYGMVLRDQSANVTFYAEDPSRTGFNPYRSLLGGSSDPLAQFPWRDLLLLKMDVRTYSNKRVSEITGR